MKKTLLYLLIISSISSFACTVDFATTSIKCKNNSMTEKSTLDDFRKNCTMDEERFVTRNNSKLYKIEFITDNRKEYQCFFNNNDKTATPIRCKFL
ncbi:MAG TPA: hypothetical protein PKD00_09705 [Burkholderiales bacterium]|nr:hypothetical protein [Burkholderiales bacterium]